MEVVWTVILIWIAIRIAWWAIRPKPDRRTQLRRTLQADRTRDDAHDAAVSVAAVLGVRDGAKRE